jgi:hypothetical protein
VAAGADAAAAMVVAGLAAVAGADLAGRQ